MEKMNEGMNKKWLKKGLLEIVEEWMNKEDGRMDE